MSATLRLNAPLSPQAEYAAALDSFYARCEALNLSSGTVGVSRDMLKLFHNYCEREDITPTLAALTTETMRDCLKKEVARRFASSARHLFVTLRVLCNHLVTDGWLDESPLKGVSAPKLPKKIMPALTADQVTALLATCENNTFTGIRDRAIITLLFDTGLRVAELLSLRVHDMDGERGQFTVMGKGAKERELPFGQQAKAALREYMRRREGVDCPALFVNTLGEPFTATGLAQMLWQRGERAKLPRALCHPHALRHGFAVAYLRAGGDVFSLQKLLGHTTLEMTRRYAELAQQDVIEKHRQCSPADALPAPKATGRKRLK